jgi:hypothetical protein
MNRTLLSSRKLSALMVLLAGFAVACANTPADRADQADQEEPQADAAAVEPVAQQDAAEVACEMTFTMEGWSAIVSKAEGEGTVTCDNGQSADVTLAVTGGGLTVGKTEIDEGKGVFSDVEDISEVFGAYAQAEASAGAVDEARSAQVLTKGEVSLAITAEGRGWTLGVSGAKFTIEKNTDSSAMSSDA